MVALQYPAGPVASRLIGAVAFYGQNAGVWIEQALLVVDNDSVKSMALAGDGKTLAVNPGGFSPHGESWLASTPHELIYMQQGNDTWSQQAKFPAGFRTVLDITGSFIGPVAVSFGLGTGGGMGAAPASESRGIGLYGQWRSHRLLMQGEWL